MLFRSEVDGYIDQVAQSQGMTRDQLRSSVEKSGKSWAAYRSELEEDLRMQRFQQYVLFPRISLTEDEVRDLYNRRAREGVPSDRRTLEAIFFRA